MFDLRRVMSHAKRTSFPIGQANGAHAATPTCCRHMQCLHFRTASRRGNLICNHFSHSLETSVGATEASTYVSENGDVVTGLQGGNVEIGGDNRYENAPTTCDTCEIERRQSATTVDHPHFGRCNESTPHKCHDRRFAFGVHCHLRTLPLHAFLRSRDVCTKHVPSESRRYGISNGPENEKNPRFRGGFSSEKSGGNLLSQGVYPQVPSARSGLTSVFGMGTGVTPTLWPPETCRPSTRVTRRRGLQSKHEHNPSPRPISTGQLHRLPCFHFRPINVVVSPRALLR